MVLNLLLADDSPTIAKILTLSLSSEDYKIRTVETADQAIQELEKETPDFFLVDAALPQKDGFSLSRFVKEHPTLSSHTKVILLSTAFEPVNEAEAIAAGADAVIVKPFDPAELRNKLRDLQSKTPTLANKEEELSANAKELANFFHAEVDASSATSELSPNAQALATFFAAEVEQKQSIDEPSQEEKISSVEEEFSRGNDLDLSNLQTDWSALSQWSTSQSPPSESMFDTGDSNFIFDQDYVNRITRSFIGSHEEETANRKQEEHLFAEASTPVPQQSQTHPEVDHTAALDKIDLERIVREEVRAVCKEAVEKVCWEVIPELAENIIRKELEKVLKSLEQ